MHQKTQIIRYKNAEKFLFMIADFLLLRAMVQLRNSKIFSFRNNLLTII